MRSSTDTIPRPNAPLPTRVESVDDNPLPHETPNRPIGGRAPGSANANVYSRQPPTSAQYQSQPTKQQPPQAPRVVHAKGIPASTTTQPPQRNVRPTSATRSHR
eukprot:TRINITY_DN6459_c0_g1_i1.p3 TRINITY_DN6459_c0_g1~~TRINITY_DN6459_c0_g1_i1.p3  ORF type:complete len:104 (+),score=18.96 TRINITY_DN6459_c0_g1_i1:214-525(+)